jgi:hypothetical protein
LTATSVWTPAYPTARLISAIGRRTIMCMLLIAAPAVIWDSLVHMKEAAN